MIKFFRRIRQKLLADNKLGRYLLYAFGEIVLVVIGILIALAINSNQQYRKERTVELNSLQKFAQELRQDSVTIQELIARERRISADIDTLYSLLTSLDNKNALKVFRKASP